MAEGLHVGARASKAVSRQGRTLTALDAIGDTPLVQIDSMIDGFVAVPSADAIAEIRRVAREQGMVVGPGSSAHLLVAKRLLQEHPELRTVVTIFCDEGEKYMSEHFLTDATRAG